MGELLSAGQVARMLGINRATVWKWRATGRLPSTTVIMPGAIRPCYGYPRKAIEKLARSISSQKKLKSVTKVIA